jgi:hypothetical protein
MLSMQHTLSFILWLTHSPRSRHNPRAAAPNDEQTFFYFNFFPYRDRLRVRLSSFQYSLLACCHGASVDCFSIHPPVSLAYCLVAVFIRDEFSFPPPSQPRREEPKLLLLHSRRLLLLPTASSGLLAVVVW